MRKTELENCPQWLLDADTENEDVVFENDVLIWQGGNFMGGDFWGNFRGGNFRGGNFRGGNFRGGNFMGGNFMGGDFLGGDFLGESITRNPVSVYGLRWIVHVTPTMLHIGCQHHTHSEWAAFSEKEIENMAPGSSKLWAKNKAFLMALCASVAK